MSLLCLRCFILLLSSFELPQMMEFCYEDIASFTFSLWEIRGCHLGDNRFPVFRTFPLRLFSCFTSFFLPRSLLPPLLAFFNFTTLFLLTASLCLSASLSPDYFVFRIPPRRPGQLAGLHAEESFSPVEMKTKSAL